MDDLPPYLCVHEKIALLSFEEACGGEAKIFTERHYLLVEPSQISKENLENYRKLVSRIGAP